MGTLPFVPSNGRKTLLHFSNNLNASTALFRDSIMMAALLHKWSITQAAVCLSSEAALGSYLLRVNGEGAAIRVRRVR